MARTDEDLSRLPRNLPVRCVVSTFWTLLDHKAIAGTAVLLGLLAGTTAIWSDEMGLAWIMSALSTLILLWAFAIGRGRAARSLDPHVFKLEMAQKRHGHQLAQAREEGKNLGRAEAKERYDALIAEESAKAEETIRQLKRRTVELEANSRDAYKTPEAVQIDFRREMDAHIVFARERRAGYVDHCEGTEAERQMDAEWGDWRERVQETLERHLLPHAAEELRDGFRGANQIHHYTEVIDGEKKYTVPYSYFYSAGLAWLEKARNSVELKFFLLS